ncbi:MAG: ANTAR domain-containing protein [Chitinivorax sp.]
MLKIMLVNDADHRLGRLRRALEDAGINVVAEVDGGIHLPQYIEAVQPDAILIDSDSPSRDILEQLVVMSQHNPRPVVMFADNADQNVIKQAIQAGVSAYVYDGIKASRIQPVLEVASARFQAEQALKCELAEVQEKLSDRKLVEKAKGILMKQKDLDENEAYQLLRRTAMNRNLKLADLAQQIISAANLLL